MFLKGRLDMTWELAVLVEVLELEQDSLTCTRLQSK